MKQPITSKPEVTKPPVAKPGTVKPAVTKPAVVEPPVSESGTEAPRDVSGAGAVFESLLQQLSSYAPDAALTAAFDAQISADDAWARGRRISSDRPLSDAMNDLPLVEKSVVGRAVLGFGPSELHYTISLALQLWHQYGAQLAATGTQARVSAEKARTVSDARAHLADLHTVLGSCLPAGSARRPEYDRALLLGDKTTARALTSARTLTLIAQHLLDDAAANPTLAQLYADKGLTPELVDGTAAKSTGTATTQRAHGAAQSEAEAAQKALDLLDGRLRNQLLRLRAQVERARAKPTGAGLPEVKLEALRATHTTPEDDEPATPVAPAATAPAPGA